jgi:hypothetical protein
LVTRSIAAYSNVPVYYREEPTGTTKATALTAFEQGNKEEKGDRPQKEAFVTTGMYPYTSTLQGEPEERKTQFGVPNRKRDFGYF